MRSEATATSGGDRQRSVVEAERACLRDALAAARRRATLDVTLGGLATGAGVELTDFVGTRTSALRGLVVRRGAGLGGRVLATGRPAVVDDYAVDDGITHDYNGPVVVREGLRSAVAVPVIVDARVAAVIYGAMRQPNALGDRTTALLLAAADGLGRELQVRREVERRIAADELQRQQAVIGDIGTAALESVREAHAHVRTLTHSVADDALRSRLEHVTNLLAGVVADPTQPRGHVTLTPRELDTLAVVALGCTTAEVAARLGVTPETVKAHLRSASRKLGTHTRHEAVVQARRLGILP